MGESIIRNKSYDFALKIIGLYKSMLKDNEYVLSKQLLKGGTSIGANVEEALAGQSKKDFIAKISIASKEARKTKYWLRLIRDSKINRIPIDSLMNDIEEIVLILTSIVKTSQQNNNSTLKTQNSYILIIILLYVMLTQSLTLTAGYSGLISLAHAGFYGIGAYSSAILSVNYGFPFLVTLPVAMLLSGLIAMFVSVIALRTVDDYFIIITLGIQIVVFSIMNNWVALTNGPLGIAGIPTLTIFGFDFSSKISFFILTLILTTLVYYLLKNITKSPFGRILIALSEDEIFTKSLGKKVYQAKVASFTIGAMFAAVPGALYAHYISYIDPTSFTVNESIFILTIVIIGGMRNLWGSAIAATVLIILPEALRFVGMPSSIAANMRQIIYGLALVFMMFKYSKGFVSKNYVGQENK